MRFGLAYLLTATLAIATVGAVYLANPRGSGGAGGPKRELRPARSRAPIPAVRWGRATRYRHSPDKAAPEGPQSSVEIKITSIGQLNELVDCRKSGHKFIISEPVHVGSPA